MFLADVTFLMRHGLRLRSSQREAPMRVSVQIRESDRDTNNSGRNLTEVMLFENWGLPQARSAGRITDPTLLPYKGNGFLLSGIELDTGNDGTAEYRQVWLVIPVEQVGP
ncbi:hypothetical protein EJO68_10240 [Variovorax atrisoli]|uniref:hypothetical protein n=1 Tax=Variovorax atrisoli TaxID=3394203 RepID=UPI000F7EDED5|nr:hypothetical protein [Variovorax sp. 369]RTD94176.1 hypothetical protein EJO68_10240 [Variovorax sp. 369]